MYTHTHTHLIPEKEKFEEKNKKDVIHSVSFQSCTTDLVVESEAFMFRRGGENLTIPILGFQLAFFFFFNKKTD